MKKRPEYSLTKTGERIRKLRKQKRISVEQIRKYLQLESMQAIYKWENGKCFPQADNLLALAKLFEVSPFEILVEKSNSEQVTRTILEYMRLRKVNCIREIEYVWSSTCV